jgi:GntR family transcriptional regulator
MSVKTYHSRPRDEIAERIECLIIEKGLKPGDRLPSERELCESWECNRMTFRAAVKRLIAEGKIKNVPATGNFVAPDKLERYLQDLTSFTEFVMKKGHTVDNRLIHSEVIKASAKVAADLHITEGADLFKMARLRLVDDEPVSLDTVHLPLEKFKGIDQYDFQKFSLYAILERKYGLVAGSGTEEISLTFADSDEAELLNIPEGEALFFLKGITCDENNEPFEVIKSVLRTDRLSFAGTLY